ncbi:hypothetical protein BGZ65_003381, partial [Modicella reniformis]
MSNSASSSRHRPWHVLILAGALSVVFIATLGTSPVQGLSLQKRAPSSDSIGDIGWIRKRLGTQSPYPHEDRPDKPLDDVPEGYELVQLHIVSPRSERGTRYPDIESSTIIGELTDKLKNTTAPDFKWIRNWSSNTWYPLTKDKLLSSRGNEDLYAIGRRFATRYKEFLDKYPYDPTTYEFRSSSKARATQSAYSFSLGFLEGRSPNSDEP